jgi:hypothetical protein
MCLINLIETAHCDQINSMECAMVLDSSSTSMKACMVSQAMCLQSSKDTLSHPYTIAASLLQTVRYAMGQHQANDLSDATHVVTQPFTIMGYDTWWDPTPRAVPSKPQHDSHTCISNPLTIPPRHHTFQLPQP